METIDSVARLLGQEGMNICLLALNRAEYTDDQLSSGEIVRRIREESVRSGLVLVPDLIEKLGNLSHSQLKSLYSVCRSFDIATAPIEIEREPWWKSTL